MHAEVLLNWVAACMPLRAQMDEPSFGAGTCHGPFGLNTEAYRAISGTRATENIKCSCFSLICRVER